MNPLQQIADNLAALNSDAPEVADAVIKLTNMAAHPSRGVVDELGADEVRDLWRATDDDEITEIEHLRRFAKRIQAATPAHDQPEGADND